MDEKTMVNEVKGIIEKQIYRITPFAGENWEELIQDGVLQACRRIRQINEKGRGVTFKTIAWRVIKNMMAGRRSYGRGKTDVYSNLGHHDRQSIYNQIDDDISLYDTIQDARLLTPFEICARKLDKEAFFATLNEQQLTIANLILEGWDGDKIATYLNLSEGRISQIRNAIIDAAERFIA